MARKQCKKILSNYPNKLYRFVCEDEKSMFHYIDKLRQKKQLKENIRIDVITSGQGTDAKSVQQYATMIRNKIRQNKDAYPRGFKVVSCFDKDKNDITDITEIIKANNKEASDMATIYNSPCYEYWLILHTEKTDRAFSTPSECASVAMSKINKKYGKKFDNVSEFKTSDKIFDIVGDDIHKAIENAKSYSYTDYNNTYTNAHIIFEEIVKK